MTWGSEWGTEWGGETGSLDLIGRARDRLWKQLESAENIAKLVDFFSELASEVDATAEDVGAKVGVDALYGDELTDFAGALGIVRNGASDDLLRRIVKATARKAFGEGDLATFYDVVAAFAPTASITIVEAFPAHILLWIHNLSTEETHRVADILRGVPGLGIGCETTIVDSNGVFEFGGDETTVTWHFSGDNTPSSETAGLAGSAIIQ